MGDEGNTSDDGLDRERLEAWFRDAVAEAEPPLRYERITGGRSNLTYRVFDSDGGRWILRRPPLGATLGSAHDMAREHRILTGLAGTAVPCPRPVAMCTDESVIGADFYVMELVDGLVLRDEDDVRAAFDEPGRRRVTEALVDTLADLHAVDPDAAGLGELGRRDGYAQRQLKRWMRQWEASKTRELEAMDETHRLLSARVPPQDSTAIVHGDYRLDNVIVSPDGEIAAVLDWELCTLGDPLADVGQLLVYWAEDTDKVVPLTRAPTLAPGFPRRVELVERYAARSGRDVSALDFFVALAYWKLAAILEGVYARFSAGQYGQTTDEYRTFGEIVEQLAGAALDAARRLE
ncbi:MAG TPA: phosphotransferase family protein [Solirubrobacteraceae bacterium]|nr:phosphotransferase family protein [Solirubrobacteraceae bacterium]